MVLFKIASSISYTQSRILRATRMCGSRDDSQFLAIIFCAGVFHPASILTISWATTVCALGVRRSGLFSYIMIDVVAVAIHVMLVIKIFSGNVEMKIAPSAVSIFGRKTSRNAARDETSIFGMRC